MFTVEFVSTKNAPDAIGPYSQAVKANGMLFTSGQIAIDPATGNVEAKTIEGQTEQVCKNLKAVCEAAGTGLDKAVKTVCFLADINDFTLLTKCTENILQTSLPEAALRLKRFPKTCFARLS